MIREILPTRSRELLVALLALLLIADIHQLANADTVRGNISLPSFCDGLSSQTSAIQQQCDQLKRQGFANAEATARAEPRATSVVTPINPAISGTPVPPGYIAPQYQAIKALETEPAIEVVVGHPWRLTSAWQVGAVLNSDPASPEYRKGFGEVIVYAAGPYPSGQSFIARELWDTGGSSSRDAKKCQASWTCPRNVGSITITSVTGPTGVVSFTSSMGANGTLNMSTGTWTFG